MTTIHVNPDSHFILSATEGTVILLGWDYDGDKAEPAVLHVTRHTFQRAMSGWLDGKANYNSMGSWAGTGDICFEDVIDWPTGAHLRKGLVDYKTRSPDKMIDVKAYKGSTFIVDMEHG
jgi:hypothetical protein